MFAAHFSKRTPYRVTDLSVAEQKKISSDCLKLVPADPHYVPNEAAQERAVDALGALLPEGRECEAQDFGREGSWLRTHPSARTLLRRRTGLSRAPQTTLGRTVPARRLELLLDEEVGLRGVHFRTPLFAPTRAAGTTASTLRPGAGQGPRAAA